MGYRLGLRFKQSCAPKDCTSSRRSSIERNDLWPEAMLSSHYGFYMICVAKPHSLMASDPLYI